MASSPTAPAKPADRLLWVDRAGKELETLGDPGEYHEPGALPDGRSPRLRPRRRAQRQARHLGPGPRARRQLAVHASAPGDTSARRGRPTARDRLQLRSRRHVDLFEKSADGPGRGEARSCTATSCKSRGDWSRTASTSRFASRNRRRSWDIWVLPMFGDEKPIPIADTPFTETDADVLSGRPVRRVSVRTSPAATEIYVQTFPGARREVADLDGGRRRPELARRRQGALLPLARSEAHGGRRSDGRRRSRPACRRRSFRSGSGRALRATGTRRPPTGSASSSSRRSAATR